jgi:DNA polymerase-3 subunit gamma/tau
LQKIADDPKDPIAASPEAIALIARAAEGSMRDAETAFDQVIAFSGKTVTVEDVATVLGLVGRDLLFDVIQAVADENGTAAFELAGRAVEAGYDLRLLCRELARLVRDLLVLSVDPSRMTDSDIAPEGDRERLKALLPRFSREDLLRSFDVLTRAESEIRGAAEPRYHLEMALLRWIHLRKLMPIEQLIERLESGAPLGGPGPSRAPAPASPLPRASAPAPPLPRASVPAPLPAPRPAPSISSASVARRLQSSAPAAPAAVSTPATVSASGQGLKDVFLAAVLKARTVLYSTTIAEALSVDVEGDRVRFRFGASHTMAADRLGREKALLESLASEAAGRRMTVTVDVVESGAKAGAGREPGATSAASPGATPEDLREKARQDPAVQALLDVFPGEIRDAKELKDA